MMELPEKPEQIINNEKKKAELPRNIRPSGQKSTTSIVAPIFCSCNQKDCLLRVMTVEQFVEHYCLKWHVVTPYLSYTDDSSYIGVKPCPASQKRKMQAHQMRIANNTMKRRLVAGRTDPDIRTFIASKKSKNRFRPHYTNAGFHGWYQF